MRQNVTYIEASKVEAVVKESGLKTKEQGGFTCVVGSNKAYRVYVARTKKVARVDISGFKSPDGTGCVVPHCGVFGNVKQQLDFSLPEDQVLANLKSLLVYMAALPAPEVKEKKAPKVSKPKKEKAVEGVEDPKVSRLELLKARVAAKKEKDAAKKAGGGVDLKAFTEGKIDSSGNPVEVKPAE